RGAVPLAERFDLYRTPVHPPRPATLIAADGSQVYPDRHGPAPYFLVNTGSIILRQGSGEAPTINSTPQIFFETHEVYTEAGQMRDVEYVNAQRDRREIETLAELAEQERARDDPRRPIITLTDGPLRPWTSQTDEQEARRQIQHFRRQLERLRAAHAIPVGYTDQPDSGYVLRILELIGLPADQITRAGLRAGPYRYLTDRALFADLLPGQRTALFALEEDNEALEGAVDHNRIVFCYLNVAREAGAEHARIVRLELPAWAGQDEKLLDTAQHAIYEDCRLTGYPYVLTRAHELAVVGAAERADLENMVGQFMLRHGLWPRASPKAEAKRAM
ncbi:MAG: DNA double-strand break repair nuclease NurA, partial [Anaerolineae bacterium]|nr:DNA double-strand break repair nuclease NurA [Anaerolineae bacterium]